MRHFQWMKMFTWIIVQWYSRHCTISLYRRHSTGCHTGIVRRIDLNDVTGDSSRLIRPSCWWFCGKLADSQWTEMWTKFFGLFLCHIECKWRCQVFANCQIGTNRYQLNFLFWQRQTKKLYANKSIYIERRYRIDKVTITEVIIELSNNLIKLRYKNNERFKNVR